MLSSLYLLEEHTLTFSQIDSSI
uniref:Uncharacterized protein n=1 Tax=Lepeophtheirus salmonis TaxID=72036 RepID=A0A0K2VI08_LEPSM